MIVLGVTIYTVYSTKAPSLLYWLSDPLDTVLYLLFNIVFRSNKILHNVIYIYNIIFDNILFA